MFHFTKSYGLFVGRLDDNVFHKHYSVQLSVSEKNTLKFKLKDSEELIVDYLLVNSNVSHRLICSEIQLTLLINPLSILGHYLKLNAGDKIINRSVIKLIENLRSELIKLKCEKINFEGFCNRVDGILIEYQCYCDKIIHIEDDRIVKTLKMFEDNYERVLSLDEVSKNVYLSPSRFLHLFKKETGLNFRRYQLWSRLVKSIPYLVDNSVTNTAHSFGFTDSSHYTRTFKETFGVNPKFLLQKE